MSESSDEEEDYLHEYLRLVNFHKGSGPEPQCTIDKVPESQNENQRENLVEENLHGANIVERYDWPNEDIDETSQEPTVVANQNVPCREPDDTVSESCPSSQVPECEEGEVEHEVNRRSTRQRQPPNTFTYPHFGSPDPRCMSLNAGQLNPPLVPVNQFNQIQWPPQQTPGSSMYVYSLYPQPDTHFYPWTYGTLGHSIPADPRYGIGISGQQSIPTV